MKSKKVIFGAVALVGVMLAVFFAGGKGFDLQSRSLSYDSVDFSALSEEEINKLVSTMSVEELDAYIAELEAKQVSNQKEIADLQSQIELFEREIAEGTTRVASLEDELKSLEASYSKAESDYQVKSAGLERLQANLTAQSGIVATQEVLLAEVESILANQINQKSIYESQITAANQQVTTLKAQSDALASTLAGIPDRINQAQGSLNRINNDIVGAETARDNAQFQVDYLQGQKTIYTTDIAKLTSEIKQLNTDLTKLNTDLTKYQAEKTKLQQQGKSTTAITDQINKTNTKINTVKGQISTKQKNKTTKEGYLKNINLQIPSADTRLKQAKANLIPLQATKTTHTNTLASLNKERTTVTGQKLVKDSELAAARISLNNLNSSQATLTGAIANSEKDKEIKKKKLTEAQTILKSAQEDFDAENIKLKPAQEKLKVQLAGLDGKKDELAGVKKDMQLAGKKKDNRTKEKEEKSDYEKWMYNQIEKLKKEKEKKEQSGKSCGDLMANSMEGGAAGGGILLLTGDTTKRCVCKEGFDADYTAVDLNDMCKCGNGKEINEEGKCVPKTSTPDPICGNSIIEPPEECDDGTLNGNYANSQCTNECKFESQVCGNGELESGESCDDGNILDGDGCSSSCQTTVIPLEPTDTTTPMGRCGDRIVQSPPEECDDGDPVLIPDGKGGDIEEGNDRGTSKCNSMCQLKQTGSENPPPSLCDGAEFYMLAEGIVPDPVVANILGLVPGKPLQYEIKQAVGKCTSGGSKNFHMDVTKLKDGNWTTDATWTCTSTDGKSEECHGKITVNPDQNVI